MKKIVYIFSISLVSLALASCAASYLDQEPAGSTITEKQYQEKENATEGSVKGVYSLMYAYGGAHDAFGQRSIDMYGDLLCGDMALKTQNYGWFSSDELMQTNSQRRAYIWAYYYDIIRICNKTINALEKEGLPELDVAVEDLSEEKQRNGFYYAELLAVRGWAYAGLLRYFTFPTADIADMSTEWGVPIYTEDDTRADTTLGAPRSPVADVYDRVENDLQTAIEYFDTYNTVKPTTKIEITGPVARALLAYSYLNKSDYANALKYAEEAITVTTTTLLLNSDVLTTGFNDINSNNWMWGKDVTVENTTSLASFFGQCDIYSYSYASAGDVKGIDENLYKQIQALGWDIREGWFNKYYNSQAKNYTSFQFAPDGKFYSATSTKLQGDRDWLSDDVFMRTELLYLIAAEAACRKNEDEKAKQYLFEITRRRIKNVAGASLEEENWENALTAHDDILEAIRYNWRVELWGEGYALQTFRRFGESVTLGSNHLRSTKTISPTQPSARYFTFELPTAETYYNRPLVEQMNELTNGN